MHNLFANLFALRTCRSDSLARFSFPLLKSGAGSEVDWIMLTVSNISRHHHQSQSLTKASCGGKREAKLVPARKREPDAVKRFLGLILLVLGIPLAQHLDDSASECAVVVVEYKYITLSVRLQSDRFVWAWERPVANWNAWSWSQNSPHSSTVCTQIESFSTPLIWAIQVANVNKKLVRPNQAPAGVCMCVLRSKCAFSWSAVDQRNILQVSVPQANTQTWSVWQIQQRLLALSFFPSRLKEMWEK